ncbi:MAG: hypothetical protein HYV33_00805 [Candidatus Kerfeldbacteria bacterium]|nr:hypothetical protein [Candidatus Kerfeldbacteria bacterium]
MLPLIVSIIALITNSILAFLLIRKGLKNATHLTFFLLILSYIVYIVPNYVAGVTESALVALWNIRLTMSIAIFQTVLFFIFAKTFPNKKIAFSRKKLYLLLLYSFSVSLFCLTPWVFSDVELVEGSVKFQNEFGLVIFGFTTATFIILGLYHLVRKYKTANGILKMQLLYIIIGTLTTYALFFFLAFLFAAVTNTDFFPKIAAIFLLPFTILATYAIIRYRFMDIRFFVKRSTAYLVSIVVVVAVYAAVILFAQQTLVEQLQWHPTITLIAAVILIAISVEPLRTWIIRVINDVLYSPREKKRVNLRKLAKHTNQEKKYLEQRYAKQLEVTAEATEYIRKAALQVMGTYLGFLEGAEVRIFIPDTNRKSFVLVYGDNKKITKIIPQDPLHLFVAQKPHILVTKEIPYLLQDDLYLEKERLAEVEHFLIKNNIEVVVPVGNYDALKAIVFIGSKPDHGLFTQEDIIALRAFQHEAKPAIEGLVNYRFAVQAGPFME